MIRKIFFFLYFLLYDFIKIRLKIIRSCFFFVANFCKMSIQIYIYIYF